MYRILSLSMIMLFFCFGIVQADPGEIQPKIMLGIDKIDDYAIFFAGKRVGLITNQTGVNRKLVSTIDVLYEKTNLTALFCPEHGIRGAVNAGEQVGNVTDVKTGLPVFSLYGDTKKPTAEMLENIDVLCFDIQDVGARYYTYMYTMAYAMQACKENNKQFVVFDRPNPVGGNLVEGGTIQPGFESFIGMYPIPIRHGLTIGELAVLFNQEYGIGCDLVVIPMTGWKRDMYFEDTGLFWVMPSPNMPTIDTAVVYTATGLFGGTNVSEGVGTTRPFEFVGASWLDPFLLADKMNQFGLPGVTFRAMYFTPKYTSHQGEVCGGVQLHITDRHAFRSVRTGFALLYTIMDLGGDQFQFKLRSNGLSTIDLVTGDDAVKERRYTFEELMNLWDKEAATFKAMSKQYYLYE